MFHLNSMVNIYVKILVNLIILIAWNESTCDEGFPKSREWLRFIVSVKNICNFYCFNILLIQISCANVENTVILIAYCNYISLLILFNQVHFNVFTFKLMLLNFFICFKTIYLKLKMVHVIMQMLCVSILSNNNSVFCIIANYNIDDATIICVNVMLVSKMLKYFFRLIKNI